jgi:hypothetical protein
MISQESFENDFVIIRIKNGILFLKYKKEIMDLPCATNVVEARLKISKGISYPLFVDISNVKNTTKEARSYTSKGDAALLVSATALWGTSELTKVMANFFLTINKPEVPVRFFSDREKALQWLQQFKTVPSDL